MDELLKALKNFIVRDIIYIIGGTSVMVSFLYLFDKICIIIDSKSTFVYLFAIGISYVIGYSLQELFCLLRFVTTADFFQPWAFLRWLYRLLCHERWEEVFRDVSSGKDHQQEVIRKLREADILINEKASQDNKAFRERITSLMMIGTTIGPCALVAGILLLVKAFYLNPHCAGSSYIWFAVVVLIICTVLILLDWIKGLQFMGPCALVSGILLLTIVFFVDADCPCKFNIWLAICVLTMSVLLILLGWIKGLQLMKNTEVLYNSLA